MSDEIKALISENETEIMKMADKLALMTNTYHEVSPF